MATRFVTTDERDVSTEFKNVYINSKKQDIIIIKSPLGMPGRAVRNAFTDKEVIASLLKEYKDAFNAEIKA